MKYRGLVNTIDHSRRLSGHSLGRTATLCQSPFSDIASVPTMGIHHARDVWQVGSQLPPTPSPSLDGFRGRDGFSHVRCTRLP